MQETLHRSTMFLRMLLLLLVIQAASFCPSTHAKGHKHGYRVVATSSLKPKPICSPLKVTPPSNRTWLPVYHRYGPCSPSHSAGKRWRALPSPATVLRRDQLRADSIHQRISLSSKKGGRRSSSSADTTTAVSTTLGIALGTLEYVVEAGLGTPPVTQTVLIDTGSDLSWVQCRPCPVPPCRRQKDALFDQRKSSTYSAVPCGSPACAQLGNYGTNNGTCSKRQCGYAVEYNDGSNTTGTYGSDTLTAAPSGVVLTNFRFGCSHAAPGFPDAVQTDGLLALGGDTPSLVSQAGARAFSYCLPPTASRTGYLALGAPHVAASRFAVTKLYRSSQSATFYFVLLRAITVAGRRLDVPPSVFSAGAIMDSGTIITRLPAPAYHALRAAFRAEMDKKRYPPAPPSGILDTCFNLTGVRAIRVPRVAFVFDRDVTVELHPSGVMQYDCLAFASNSAGQSAGIIGNVQQRTIEVVYDVGGGAVGFRRGAC